MFRLSVLQNQWLMLSVFGGLALLLFIVCFYFMMWRPRIEQTEPLSGGRVLIRWIPWILYFLVIGIIIYQVVHTVLLHFYAQNI